MAWLARAHIRLALWLDRSPEPPESRWALNLTLRDSEPCLSVALMFCPSLYPGSPYHIVMIVQHAGLTWLVGAGQNTLLAPLAVRLTLRRRQALERAFRAKYVVHVIAPVHGTQPDVGTGLGPCTCATVAKQMIGVHNPDIITPRQLLAHLWRMRNE